MIYARNYPRKKLFMQLLDLEFRNVSESFALKLKVQKRAFDHIISHGMTQPQELLPHVGTYGSVLLLPPRILPQLGGGPRGCRCPQRSRRRRREGRGGRPPERISFVYIVYISICLFVNTP